MHKPFYRILCLVMAVLMALASVTAVFLALLG